MAHRLRQRVPSVRVALETSERFGTLESVSATPPAQPDFARPLTQPRDRLELVEFVHESPGLQETDYLEWKTGYDLAKRPDAAKTAKHLIGFANRTVAAASRHCCGHAYLLLGVEPGSYVDVPEWDSADVQNWLERFVERELRYDIHYVKADGHRVLVFSLDAPRAGDPIYALQKDSQDENGKTMPAGTIYVRRPGKTDRHSPDDLRALHGRLLAGAVDAVPALDLQLKANADMLYALEEPAFSDKRRDDFLDRYRREELAALPAPDPWLGDVGLRLTPGEFRSREEFTSEVESFVAQTKKKWAQFIASEYARHYPALLRFTIVNDTSENFEDVVIEIRLPVAANAVHLDADDAAQRLDAPERPLSWGESPVLNPRGWFDPDDEHPRVLAEDGVTLVISPRAHVRPHSPYDLPMLLFTLGPDWQDKTMTATWRATARNTKGDLSGDVSFRVATWDEHLAAAAS